MLVKAKYKFMGGIHYKYFHNVKEMEDWFNNTSAVRFISFESGERIRQEAAALGWF